MSDMIEEKGCPEGMYPLDAFYEAEEVYEDFEEFKEYAEGLPPLLNLPLSYYFVPADEDPEEEGRPHFQLVFFMPRKGRTFALATRYESFEQVLSWLNPWLKERFNEWFEWEGES